LTKYANWEGDVMMGSAVFPKSSTLGLEIKRKAVEYSTRPFIRDMERTAEQIPFYNNFIDRTNQSQEEIVNFLQSHPKVKKVFWAYQESTGSNYTRIAGEHKPGCVVSFEVDGCFKDFYDNLDLLKSPSFGTEFSLCCPYIYLAHYNLIGKTSGQEKLRHAGLSPELLRLSVGLESPDEIKQKIALALKKC
jgi:cystathionine gamma-synthase